MDDEPSPDASLDYCSGCGVCTQVCPQGVHIAEINTQARAKLKETQGFKLRDRLIARPTRARPARHAGGAGRQPHAGEQAVPARGGEGRRRAPRRGGAEVRRPDVPALGARATTAPAAATRRVAYFHGCGANYYEPRLGEMTVELLEHNGIAVDVPKQDCCGLPLQSNGMFDDARRYVHKLAERLAPYARDGVDIVGTSTSCTLMLKREALEILGHGGRRGAARGLRARLRHLRVPARDARPRRARRRTSRRSRSRSSTTRRASSRGTASASRRWS